MLKSNSITLLAICLCATLAHAQKDSTYKPTLSIVVNPTLLLTGQEEVIAEYQPLPRLAFMFGGGYNADIYATEGYGAGGQGFTIRGGIMLATGPKSKNYIAFTGFFRSWNLAEAESEGPMPNTSDFGDYIINSTALLSSSIQDDQFIYTFKATVNVACYDIEDIVDLVKTKHFIFQMYGGIGGRAKSISLTNTGYYYSVENPTYVATQPTSAGTLNTSVFDFKLGFFIGYTF